MGHLLKYVAHNSESAELKNMLKSSHYKCSWEVFLNFHFYEVYYVLILNCVLGFIILLKFSVFSDTNNLGLNVPRTPKFCQLCSRSAKFTSIGPRLYIFFLLTPQGSYFSLNELDKLLTQQLTLGYARTMVSLSQVTFTYVDWFLKP